jgi:hypothetical protein
MERTKALAHAHGMAYSSTKARTLTSLDIGRARAQAPL